MHARAAAAQVLLLLMVAHSPALAQPQQSRPATPGSGAAQSPIAPAGAKPKPGQRFTDTVPGSLVSWEMIPLPTPPGNVSRAKALWIGKTEVPWELYDIYAFRLDLSEEEKAKDSAEKNASDAASRPSRPYGAPDHGMGHQGFAAQSMTYASAAKFCEWLSKKTGKKYRLPTETEWAWAARAGGKDPEKPANLQAIAWYWDNADDKTQPVATKNPNALGIHDMLGNVWEWTTATGGGGVVRGGSYRDKAANVHVGARAVYSPSWQTTDPQNPKSKWWLSDAPFVGFRVVCEG